MLKRTLVVVALSLGASFALPEVSEAHRRYRGYRRYGGYRPSFHLGYAPGYYPAFSIGSIGGIGYGLPTRISRSGGKRAGCSCAATRRNQEYTAPFRCSVRFSIR